MLSIHVHQSAAKLTSYHEDHLTKGVVSDYYVKENEPALTAWIGKGAERLGIADQTVTQTHFERLANNRHPLTNQPLTPRHKKDARSAYDLTFSTPKSVSVMALEMGDDRLVQAHVESVKEAVEYLQSQTMVRVRKGGVSEDRVTGNLVGAMFLHFTSRENDPQMHSHCVIKNATWDEEEQRWKAVQAVEFFRQSGLATEIYRSSLCAKLHAMGYATETRGSSFEIVGVTKAVIDRFSKRKQQIDRIADDLGHSNNPELRQSIARQHRKKKDTTTSIHTLRERWKNELAPSEYADLEAIKAAATGPVKMEKISPEEALDWAKRHLFERRSVVRSTKLCEVALAHARGHFDLASVQAALLGSEQFIVHENEVTTPEVLASEQTLNAFIENGVGIKSPLAENAAISGRLSEEQRGAVATLLLCPDRYATFRGPAGSGKTTTLSALVEAIRGEHSSIQICAPSAAAVDVLHRDGFGDADTLQRFLLDEEKQADVAGGVFILDESGLTSLDDMLRLFTLAEQHDFRVILAGDSRQHKSVAAGDALRLIEQHPAIYRAELSTIFRQQHDEYLSAVCHLKDGQSEQGFDVLDGLGWVKEVDDDNRYQQLASDFADARYHDEEALAVAATWREASMVTGEVRAALRLRGIVRDEDQTVSVLLPLHHTEAQRELSCAFLPGHVLEFQRKSTLFAAHEQVTVLGALDGKLTVERTNGETLVINPKRHAKNMQAFATAEIPVASGDQLLLRSNGKDADGVGLKNGQLVTIKSVAADGSISLTDGRNLPASYRHFSHGYCITSQASQGQTVDRVFVAIDAMSAATATFEETLYVAASRGRHSCTLYTDAKDILKSAFNSSGNRKAATELLNLTPKKHHEPDTAILTTDAHPRPGKSVPAIRTPSRAKRNYYPHARAQDWHRADSKRRHVPRDSDRGADALRAQGPQQIDFSHHDGRELSVTQIPIPELPGFYCPRVR